MANIRLPPVFPLSSAEPSYPSQRTPDQDKSVRERIFSMLSFPKLPRVYYKPRLYFSTMLSLSFEAACRKEATTLRIRSSEHGVGQSPPQSSTLR